MSLYRVRDGSEESFVEAAGIMAAYALWKAHIADENGEDDVSWLEPDSIELLGEGPVIRDTAESS